MENWFLHEIMPGPKRKKAGSTKKRTGVIKKRKPTRATGRATTKKRATKR